MKINLNEILYAVSYGLDAASTEYLGTSTGHSKRIAVLSILVGKEMGLTEKELIDLAAYSILHDNALTEFNQEDLEYRKYNNGLGYGEREYLLRHCTIGEINTKLLPFRTNNRDVILLHHENADGSGPFHKTSDKTPVKAQLIHLGDTLDKNFKLDILTPDNYNNIMYFVESNSGILFSREIVTAFKSVFKLKAMTYLAHQNVDTFLRSSIRNYEDDYTPQEIHNLASLFARIVDFKSHYSCKHSIGVATKAEIMANFYSYPEAKTQQYYLAGALHDIGKLMIKNAILKKPDKLTDEEFETMKQHAYYTYQALSSIKGMKDVCKWASHHHEKLNGGGYPFGMTSKKLTQEECLLTCCDIYQALTEERPYKEGFTHAQSIDIMRDMVMRGELDPQIVDDIDQVFRNYRQPVTTVTSILKGL